MPDKMLTEMGFDEFEAIRILVRELGLVDTARFLNQYSGGYGNYTAERELLFADLTFDEIVDEIKAARQQTGDG